MIMNTCSTADLLQDVEQALLYVVGGGIGLDHFCSDGPLLAMENILQKLVVLQPFLCADFPEINQVLHSVRELVDEMIALEDETQRQSRYRGRPKVEITEADLLNLLELQFTQVEIAKLYGCSPRTIRRILEYGLEDFVRFSDISDQHLDELVTQFVNAFPCAGQKTLAGYLQSQSYHIQRWRIRESMLRVDPWGDRTKNAQNFTLQEIQSQGSK